jgi:hypothetical protein
MYGIMRSRNLHVIEQDCKNIINEMIMKMKKLKSSSVKILKMFHILHAFSWLVGCLALCFGLFLTFPESGDELYMRSRMLQITDDWLIIPGGTGAIITGLIY